MSRGMSFILAIIVVIGTAWGLTALKTNEPIDANNEKASQAGESGRNGISSSETLNVKNTDESDSVRFQERLNFEASETMGEVIDSLLIEHDEIHANVRAYTDPIGTEGRQFAAATAHMSRTELVAFREMRGNEIVRTSGGILSPNYVEANDCQGTACVKKIIDTSKNTVVFDGIWAEGFNATGVGKEVVRVK